MTHRRRAPISLGRAAIRRLGWLERNAEWNERSLKMIIADTAAVLQVRFARGRNLTNYRFFTVDDYSRCCCCALLLSSKRRARFRRIDTPQNEDEETCHCAWYFQVLLCSFFPAAFFSSSSAFFSSSANLSFAAITSAILAPPLTRVVPTEQKNHGPQASHTNEKGGTISAAWSPSPSS